LGTVSSWGGGIHTSSWSGGAWDFEKAADSLRKETRAGMAEGEKRRASENMG